MKVKDLIKLLQQVDQEMPVVEGDYSYGDLEGYNTPKTLRMVDVQKRSSDEEGWRSEFFYPYEDEDEYPIIKVLLIGGG